MTQSGDVLNQSRNSILIRVHFRLLCMGRRHTNIFQQERGHPHNTWILQTGLGLDKRQCSLQIMFIPEGVQLKLGVIF